MSKRKVYSRQSLKLAEVFAPGDFIRDELRARGWTQARFAHILARPPQFVNELINVKRSVTARTALELAAAFGTSPELWLNLEMTWQLSRLDKPDPAIARRARHASAA
jgi:HTH-type transcriptional regulator / antitoxin HigA